MNGVHIEGFEQRRRRAMAHLDAFIDVVSGWSGRYEDDDAPASIRWITFVIPECQPEPQRGWLCVSGTATPGIGWECSADGFRLCSLDGSLGRLSWPITRRQFRSAARKSNVCLTSRHATLCLDREFLDGCWGGIVAEWAGRPNPEFDY